MKVLIDCGAHDGENWVWFLNRHKAQECEIYAFEANPELDIVKSFEGREDGFIKVINKAVSDRDGTSDFYIMESDLSSSLHKKPYGKIKRVIETECVDLARWIKENLNPKDSIYLKLDVEGEEYRLLPHLLKEGIFDEYVNELYVEFHNKKMKLKPV